MKIETISLLPTELLTNTILYTHENNGFDDLFISAKYYEKFLEWFKSVNIIVVSVTIWEMYLGEFSLVGSWNIKQDTNYIEAKLYLDNLEDNLKKDNIYLTFETVNNYNNK